MKLSTKGRYAVTAMLDLAFHNKQKPVTLTDIAKRQTISLSYLEQLFARLRKANIVIGVRGPGGGYQFSRNINEINIAEIIAAVDESIDSTQCKGKGNCQNDQPCLTHELWTDLSQQIRDYLSNITLEDLINREKIKQISKRQDRQSISIPPLRHSIQSIR